MQAFEGTEKKLAIFVASGAERGSLRDWPTERWSAILDTVGATVLSAMSGRACDALLLSESSLFVFDDRLWLITCGRTTPVHAVPPLLQAIGPDHLRGLFYERQTERLPELQKTTFAEDVRFLETRVSGETVRFGAETGRPIDLFSLRRPLKATVGAAWLEVLMEGIDPAVARRFRKGPEDVRAVVASLGLAELFDGFRVDDHLFGPQGYSLNAVRGTDCYTFHVTPEPDASYVGFATNHVGSAPAGELVEAIIQLFGPRTCQVLALGPSGKPVGMPESASLRHQEKATLACGLEAAYGCYTPQASDSRSGQ